MAGENNPGVHLGLAVGIGLLLAALYLGLARGAGAGATIVALIGASALAGWVRARRK